MQFKLSSAQFLNITKKCLTLLKQMVYRRLHTSSLLPKVPLKQFNTFSSLHTPRKTAVCTTVLALRPKFEYIFKNQNWDETGRSGAVTLIELSPIREDTRMEKHQCHSIWIFLTLASQDMYIGQIYFNFLHTVYQIQFIAARFG
jgi:hypothetical protein